MQEENIKRFNKVYGAIGEKIVSEYLEKLEYRVVEKNYKNFLGEIDIICTKKVNKEVLYVFVEVKYRNSKKFGLPREAVTKQKQKTIKKVASYYLKCKGLFNKVLVRFDCLEVLGGVEGSEPEVNLIENAF